MARREFLALGKVFDPNRHNVGGYYMSEKLDGRRVWWDGGLTRGRETVRVPWAGIIDFKTGQMKKKIKPISTGLWSRYGNPIMAPDWFLNQLPSMPLDGELFAGRGKFQRTMSITSKDKPIDEEWKDITYPIFSSPNLWDVMAEGEIKNPNMVCDIRLGKIQQYVNQIVSSGFLSDWTHLSDPSGLQFKDELIHLNNDLDQGSDIVYLISQTKLPNDTIEAREMAMAAARNIIAEGGEGVILRNPTAVWTPKRTFDILKLKACQDAEGLVVGFTSGRKTGRGSKLLGMIGSLVLDFNGLRLELAGLNNDERQFAEERMSCYASDHPGKDMPPQFVGKHFKVGDSVTFLYRELSDSGIPKDARYLRERPPE